MTTPDFIKALAVLIGIVVAYLIGIADGYRSGKRAALHERSPFPDLDGPRPPE